MKNRNIYILTEAVQSGKTTLLMNWIESNSLSIGGILTPDINGRRKLFLISGKKYFDFEVEDGFTNELLIVGKYKFDKNIFTLAQNTLLDSIHFNHEWIVVDEIGKLELYQQSGLEPALSRVINHFQNSVTNQKLLLVVRDYLLEECITYYKLQGASLLSKDFFETQNFISRATKNLFGLVLCGGESKRMGLDKSFLSYHDIPQLYYLYHLLSEVCSCVFISCNSAQAATIPSGYQFIIDEEAYSKHGPISGLLSAFEKHPGNDFLVIGCDYPFLRKEDLIKLCTMKTVANATCYFNPESNFIEPLLALYKKECFSLLVESFINKEYSLRTFLEKNNATKIPPSNANLLKNINTPEEYKNALLNLNP